MKSIQEDEIVWRKNNEDKGNITNMNNWEFHHKITQEYLGCIFPHG